MSASEIKTVLFIDDEIALSHSLQSKLEEEGYRVRVCDEVRIARQVASEEKFDCIVVDQKLRGGSGDAIVFEIRNDPHHINHATPVLMMSAHLGDELLRTYGHLIEGALTKPFERKALAEKVKRITR